MPNADDRQSAPSAADFERLCDVVEVLLAFASLDPRPLTGTPAEAAIWAFKNMREERRAERG